MLSLPLHAERCSRPPWARTKHEALAVVHRIAHRTAATSQCVMPLAAQPRFMMGNAAHCMQLKKSLFADA